ncbi:MAG: hypothetical protein A3J28_11835 [Acidobacteria bacterium RIFCSPLOWO2_12_FULL_60_22]|nr:MAG: hypothetical protein A3J28_11835 [Acidobacteria bacterium RIFCSPLOWO2_12_FULL_60_22]
MAGEKEYSLNGMNLEELLEAMWQQQEQIDLREARTRRTARKKEPFHERATENPIVREHRVRNSTARSR